jgi:hypothetical protein
MEAGYSPMTAAIIPDRVNFPPSRQEGIFSQASLRDSPGRDNTREDDPDSTPMRDPAEVIARKLDEVVGKRYEPVEGKLVRRAGARLARWIVGTLCAIAAVATIVWVIESHRLPKDMPQRAGKPVTVTIVPGPGKTP